METMEELIEKGLSYRKIAKILGLHPSTISYRMKMKGIRKVNPNSFIKEGSLISCLDCKREYVKDRKKGHKGNICNSCSSRRKERLYKKEISNIVGEVCCRCGYDKCESALEYHHIKNKDYSMSKSFSKVPIAKLRDEALKCITLCSNCHREYHSKIWDYSSLINLKDYQKKLIL